MGAAGGGGGLGLESTNELVSAIRRVLPAVLIAILVVVIFSVVITVTSGFSFLIIHAINNSGVNISKTYNFLGAIAPYFGSIGSMIGLSLLVSIIAVMIVIVIAVAVLVMRQSEQLGGMGY